MTDNGKTKEEGEEEIEDGEEVDAVAADVEENENQNEQIGFFKQIIKFEDTSRSIEVRLSHSPNPYIYIYIYIYI